MKESKPLLAIALIMVIAILPGLLMKRPVPPVTPDTTMIPIDAAELSAPQAAGDGVPTTGDGQATPSNDQATDSVAAAPVADDTVVVRSGLYEYRFSTRGARLVSARFLNYRSMHPGDVGPDGEKAVLELIAPGDAMLESRMLFPSDTARFNASVFTASATDVNVTDAPATLTFSGRVAGRATVIQYSFVPDDYRIEVRGGMDGVGPNGATLLVGLGNGFRDVESNVAENHRESGIVTKQDDTELHRFSSLDPQRTEIFSGPFEWVAVKSKYFVAGFFSYDDSGNMGVQGRIGGVLAYPADAAPSRPIRAHTSFTMAVTAEGAWHGTMYLGPMEYDRLTAMGRGFDDVNPYGWPGFRTIIRPFAVGIRAVFVWMHQSIGLHYGFAIIVFGILIRMLLWPLNHKAMRSMTAMQAIQPELQAIQAKYKEDPARLQQEMLKLYREHKVNPFGGCWPMLIPYPFLLAVFFVLQNTIELRGVSFLWMPDLSRPDPFYIIPVIMAVSMFGLSKIGQRGIPPNPQARMMTYVLPVVFLVMFANFASGLNMYYSMFNLVAIPQQWLISEERMKLNASKRK